jgi:hypothetical protein
VVSILGTVDMVLDNHRVHRDGSFWRCEFCNGTWPFPSPIPQAEHRCVPRKWGADPGSANPPAGPQACRTCGATGDEQCRDLRSVNRRMPLPHPGRPQ